MSTAPNWDLLGKIVTLGTLIGWAWVLSHRLKRVWRGLWWVTVKGFGASATFSGGVVIAADGWAAWNFPRFMSFQSFQALIGSSLGAGIGLALFGLLGLYAVTGGIWVTIPKTRLGKYVKRRFYGRGDVESRKPKTREWNGLKKKAPAASIL